MNALYCKRGGFAFLEILLVVIVIAVMSSWYFSKGGSQQQAASQYQRSMDTSKSAACIAGRSSMRTAIISWQMQNTGKPLTKEALAQSNINIANICPEKGEITINPDDTLSCSIHKP